MVPASAPSIVASIRITFPACCIASSRRKLPVPPSSQSTPRGRSAFPTSFTTCTPIPSSPISTLPMPSISTFVLLFSDLIVSFKFPSADDRGRRTASLDKVVVKDQIDVDDREYHEGPHRNVMPLPNGRIATHKRYDPAEQLRQPCIAHTCV